HRALHGDCRVLTWLLGCPATVVRRHRHGLPVGIQEHLVRGEPQALGRVAWPAHPIAVELPGRETRHEDVPVVVRAMPLGIEANDAGGVCRLHVREKQQFHQGGAFGEHTEVHPLRGQGRTERTTSPAPNGCRAHHGLSSLPRGGDHPLNRGTALSTSGPAVSQAMVGTTSSHSWVILTMSASASVTECTPTCMACCMVASSSCSTCSTLAMKSGESPSSVASATLSR